MPESGDLASRNRRRVPGLRREELAQLAGVSVDYYIRLERGRRITPSEDVLNALADALRLDGPTKEHMRDLARANSQSQRRQGSPVQQARPGMLRLMESFGGLPSVLLGRRTDILAVSPTARVLIADFHAMPARARNAARWILRSERARELHVDWEAAAVGLLGMLRMDTGRYPNDPRTAELIDELRTTSEHFARLWNKWEVGTSIVPGSTVLEHPLAGRIRFHVEAVTTPRDKDQVLQVLIPADSTSRSAVGELQTQAGSRSAKAG
jgi:transcriptional regulator with XRE-family HTH domain